jgi:hypothetical protein
MVKTLILIENYYLVIGGSFSRCQEGHGWFKPKVQNHPGSPLLERHETNTTEPGRWLTTGSKDT